MTETDDIKFIRRCVELASKAEGMTYPNPVVGAVIVYEGKIIGEGYHLKAGGPHAEVLAIDSVKDRQKLSGSTLYVSLEPCSHFGKTPPCTSLIINSKIPVVVAGTIDTSDKVCGNGFAMLREAGIKVIHDIAQDECRWINRRFFTFHEKKRPYIILKWAQSSDGFIDYKRVRNKPQGPGWITGNSEKILVHRWRATEQSILVGAETARNDNPLLNVREWSGNNPVRLILSGSGLLPENLSMNSLIGSQVIFTFHPDRLNHSTSVIVKLNKKEPAALQVVDYLYKWGIQSLFIEGGTKVLNHFISTGLWDEARIFHGKQVFQEGIKAPEIEGKLLSKTKFSNSILEFIINNRR
jgi:diaminohydroxyphosphoribosylaminopyrimidine deaminase/5-amino-6-(5-phosphoribosylamino)uracil reductase